MQRGQLQNLIGNLAQYEMASKEIFVSHLQNLKRQFLEVKQEISGKDKQSRDVSTQYEQMGPSEKRNVHEATVATGTGKSPEVDVVKKPTLSDIKANFEKILQEQKTMQQQHATLFKKQERLLQQQANLEGKLLTIIKRQN